MSPWAHDTNKEGNKSCVQECNPRFSAQKVIKSTHRSADPGSCETLLHDCKPTHKSLGRELNEPKGTYEDAHLTPDHSCNILRNVRMKQCW